MKSPIQLLLLLPALASPLFASATTIIIDNQCVFDIELWERAINVTVIPTGGPAYVKEVAVPSSFTWSHRRGYQATRTFVPLIALLYYKWLGTTNLL